MSIEQVVLLDASGQVSGTADKATVHHGDTPLHLAFSAYLFTADEELLVSRRASTKVAFPGVVTNSVCGHPAPAEDLARAVRRRASQELGVPDLEPRLMLPAFRYRAEMDGVIENEMCPVFVARVDPAEVRPDPSEVGEVTWMPWATFVDQVLSGALPVSPWCRLQVAELTTLGQHPHDWSTADSALLPPAARLGSAP